MHPLAKHIRDVPDYPKKGIIFKDITTLLKNPSAVREAIDLFVEKYRNSPIDKIACIEARGFILGSILAHELNVGFVPIRKKGKLPAQTVSEEYELEYGTDIVEIHRDAIGKGDRVLLHDDLLATGGTAAASCRLIEQLGGSVAGIGFLIELSFLKGRNLLSRYDVFSIIQYESE